jgi:RNA 2',3'-cyclic 3'-phosphodiesterase
MKKGGKQKAESRRQSNSSFNVQRSPLVVHPSSLCPHPSLRVFCAIELPEEVRARAADRITRLREAVPEARASWERTEKLHITLKFLGEIAPERVEVLSGAATRAAQTIQPFMLALSGAGAFPPRGIPRILWLGIEDHSGALAQLHSQLENECEVVGFAREKRSFHPHLTLARIRAPQGARELAKLHQEIVFEPIKFDVTNLSVMRSELGPGGSRYTLISRHEFGVA